MTSGWLDLVLQRVRIGVEFLDDLHPLLILCMAWFLNAQTQSIYPQRRYATIASHLACLILFLYLGIHYFAGDLDDAWMVAVCFGRGVLIFQIVLALLMLFHAEILTPVEALWVLRFLCFNRLPRLVVRLYTWTRWLIPPPPPQPSSPPLTRAELRQQALDQFRETYRHKLHLIHGSRLPRTERRAIREQAKRRYLQQLRRLIDE